jgi:cysteine desulfurase/selenocysteine lyase
MRHTLCRVRVLRVATTAQLDRSRVDAEFPVAREVRYFNSAAEGLLPAVGREAMLRYADDKARGEPGRAGMYATETRLRAAVGARIGARADQVTFLPSAARGVGAVLEAIDWQPGDNVVTGEAEFPTNVLGPLGLGRHGVETRFVPSPGGRHGYVALERLVDPRTRLVIVSSVSFRTGFRVDLERVANAAHASGALLLVDATQAFGDVPVSLAPADIVVASTFKWALAIHGAAVFALADTVRDLQPATVGWRAVRDLFAPDRFERYDLWPDARRFDEGMPPFAAQYVLEATLRLLDELGPEAIESTVGRHVERLRAGLEDLGIGTLASPEQRERAGIIAFETGDAEAIAADLGQRGILVWGRDGRVRLSPHVYTSEEDVDAALASLAAATS